MSGRTDWTREQLLIALKLYCELPFGQFDQRNATIKKWASAIGRTPSALAMKLGNFASLDPKITDSGRRGLTGASAADKIAWQSMNKNWEAFVEDSQAAVRTFQAEETTIDEYSLDTPLLMPDMPATFIGKTRNVVTEARVGQPFFRRAVLSAYSSTCCISGINVPRLLIASHIAPWRSNPNDRLNPRNGLCLSALHDRAFDSGLIYLNDSLEVVLSKALTSRKLDSFTLTALASFEGKQITLPDKFPPDPEFVRQHRNAALFQQ